MQKVLYDISTAVHSDTELPLRLCPHQHDAHPRVPLIGGHLFDVVSVPKPPLNGNARIFPFDEILFDVLFILVELDEPYDARQCHRDQRQPTSLYPALNCPFSQTFFSLNVCSFLFFHDGGHDTFFALKLLRRGHLQPLSIEVISFVAELLFAAPGSVLAVEQRAVSRPENVVCHHQSAANFPPSFFPDPVDIDFELKAMIEPAIPRKVLVHFPKVLGL